jgi:hypothetical protein
MADSTFWRDLAAKFRALDPNGIISAPWDCTVKSGRPWQWQLVGGTPGLHSQFEALARRGASEMPKPEYSDLLLSWLEAVRKTSFDISGANYYTEQNADGTDGAHHVTGIVKRICEASSAFCNTLESEALQAEFEAKQPPGKAEAAQLVINSRTDPKALRDSYLANFPDEKIKIRDLCWAVRQHRREWTRWLAGELKDGSTPDLAFRRILTSGKRPRELDKTPRPKGWE